MQNPNIPERLGRLARITGLSLCLGALAPTATVALKDVPTGPASGSIDLMTRSGVELVAGQWLYSDAELVEVDFRAAGPEGQATGRPVRTYDLVPRAGGVDFDDSGFEPIDPASLTQRRGNGRVSFNWYRIRLTVPPQVGDFETRDSTLVFETSVDDYAEVWVDGELVRGFGQQGGSVVAGWNARNRLVVGRRVTPGQQIQLAVFGMNGPISSSPTNFIYMRTARLDFYHDQKGPVAVETSEVNVEVDRIDPEIDAIVGPNPKIFKLADGFRFTEGPVWVREGGFLLFSDPNDNTIYKYTPAERIGQLAVFRRPSGYSGADIGEFRQPGSNGLTVDRAGRLTVAEHGNHRISRLDGKTLNGKAQATVLADRFEGKRLNSPNDLVYRSDGTLFFTDPPFGLPKFGDDPRKELSFSGVYALRPDAGDGAMTLIDKSLSGPNGIAFSPDERFLYVGDWDDNHKVVMRYPVLADGSIGPGEEFFDMTKAPGEDALDGIKVDRAGNLYVSGPGGLWLLSSDGRHLGTIHAPKHIHNMAWGGDDGKTLYLCARGSLYLMPLLIEGATAANSAR